VAHRHPADSDVRRPVTVTPVTADNWRDVADLGVTSEQEAFVAPVTRYLALCAYDNGPWQPWAISTRDAVVGFVMSAVDPDDHCYWIGGLVVDGKHQHRGLGRAAMTVLIDRAREAHRPCVALSYAPDNQAARRLYASLGFTETDQRLDEEIVARLLLDQAD
jgi:diamine N-acetyltransferase